MYYQCNDAVEILMKPSIQAIRSDFDTIALLSKDESGHNITYYSFLLKQLPLRCETSLEIGCGTGAFSRLLAARSDHVLAIDLSPNMVEIAKDHSQQYPNIDFQTADAMNVEFCPQSFDCIVSIATLHHTQMEQMLEKMRSALKIGGILVIHDLFEPEGLFDAAASALAIPTNIAVRLIRSGRLRSRKEVREAWAEHGRHDDYLTMAQVRRLYTEILPGGLIKRHLLWRYTVIWNKPE
jgi:ubiquinone/menaquinone biosynthesis C-methylase UbiE